MPLSPETDRLIAEAGAAARADGFVMVGMYINPAAGEVGVYSSENFPTGQTLGFVQQTAAFLIDRAKVGDLEVLESQKGLIH